MARAAGFLGLDATTVGILSGMSGQLFSLLLQAEPIRLEVVEAPGETRMATLIHDNTTNTATVLNEVGSSIDQDTQNRFIQRIKTLAPLASAVALTGSLQPGLTDDTYGSIIDYLNGIGVISVVDAKGDVLSDALKARPTVAKVNFNEANQVFGQQTDQKKSIEQQAIHLAIELQKAGAVTGIVTVGPLGAAVAAADSRSFYYAPRVTTKNDVGAGDTFLAALVKGLQAAKTMPDACKFAVAAAAASAETLQPGHLHPARIDELILQVRESWQ